MSDRYSKRDAVAAFHRLREAAGKPLATDFKIHDPRREGAWLLDENHVYGGYVIVAIAKDSPPREGDDRPQAYTSHSNPFGHTRRNAREFCNFVGAVLAGMSLESDTA